MTIQSLTQGRPIIFNEEEHNAKMLQRREAYLAAKAANENDVKYSSNADLLSAMKDAPYLIGFSHESLTAAFESYNKFRDDIMKNYAEGEEKTQKLDSLDMRFYSNVNDAMASSFFHSTDFFPYDGTNKSLFNADTEMYKQMKNEIQENVPAGETRDKMTEILDKRFKSKLEFNTSLLSLAFIPRSYEFEMSTKDPRYAETVAAFNNERQKRDGMSSAKAKIVGEISQLYSDIIDNNINVLINGAYDSRYMSGQYRFSLSDAEILSGGFWADLSKEEKQLEDAGIKGEGKYEILSQKLKKSGLGKYAQKRLDDFIKML